MIAAVLTTVQVPTPAIRSLLASMAQYPLALVVAGDRKGPAAYDLPSTTFLSLQAQLEGPFELARKLPTGHYCRKNISYLEAIRQGATCIYETDDDNAPLPTWVPREEHVREVRVVAHEAHESARMGESTHGAHGTHGKGRGTAEPQDHGTTDAVSHRHTFTPSRWVNVYRYFTDELIWPRGLPLDEIHTPVPAASAAGDQMSGVGRSLGSCHSCDSWAGLRSPIQQGLVNGSPDVDAVWRLALDRPFKFDERPSVYLAPGNWCPFNTQSTWWWPVVYPLLYVPSHCSFRMCDIWKSFVAQRCLWELGLGVVFHAPEVVQDRNPHNLMRDFADEIPGYQHNRELAQVLEKASLESGETEVAGNLLRCYEALVQAGILPTEELGLVRIWLEDMRRQTAHE
jgi:hypothetical protein